MRLIDADALSERVCLVISNSKELVTSSVVRKAVLSLIDTQPAIEAESVKPVKSKLSWEHGYNWDIWDCGHCGSQLRSDANYCDRCGHKVNWDDMEESDA